MLDKIPDPSLRVYVVWLPILGGDREDGAEQMTALIPDLRAVQFWDLDQITGKTYAKALGLRSDQYAWDVYLVFPPGVRWESEAPRPVYWMHQLFYPSDNYLNGEKLRDEVERTLRSTSASPQAAAPAPYDTLFAVRFAGPIHPANLDARRRLSYG